MSELGGQARVWSTPGGGVTIELDWQESGSSRQAFALRDLGTSARVFAAPVLIAFSIFGLVSMLMTFPEIASPELGWLALMMYIGMSAAVIWSTRTSGIPGWLVIAVCLAAPFVYRLQAASTSAADSGYWTDWASECIAALFLVIAAAGRPWWAWLAALASWLVIQGGFPLELIQPGSAVIYAGALYARSVRHNARRFDRFNKQRLQELANAEVAEQEMALLSRRYVLLDESGALVLLTGIVQGKTDPADALVREQADREEHYIRAVMRIGAVDDPVHDVAAEVLTWGRAREISVDIDVPSDPIAVSNVSDLREMLARAFAISAGATSARLSARAEGSTIVIRLVIAGCVDHEIPREQRGAATMVWLGEGDLMVEARYDS